MSRKRWIEEQRRREFEAEARRQLLEAAAAARTPGNEEAKVLRELEANLIGSAGAEFFGFA
jgi:hypothetical protein